MINVLEELRRADSRIFDRLADGELCPADQRILLAALDDEPCGWRRAALAFIEAQTLRRELAEWQSAAEPSPAKEMARQTRILRPNLRRQLALAAALCLTFGVGLLCGVSRPFGQRHVTGDDLAEHDSPQRHRAADENVANGDVESWAADASDRKGVSDGTLRLTIAGPTPGDIQNIELPLVFATHVDPEWLKGQESAIPGDVLDAWHKAGHVVTRRQEVWPVDLGDGRQMLLPVEQVEIDYATDRTVF